MFTPKSKELLSAAAARLKLESKASTVFQKHGISGIFTNPKYQGFADIEEYLLLIKIKIKKEEYADFLRSITPAIFELFVMYLKNRCGFDIADYTVTDRFGVMKWDPAKLAGTSELKILNKRYQGSFKADSVVYSDALSELIVRSAPDNDAKRIVDDLRNKVEKSLRNKAAHTIISITEQKIKADTGLSAEEIFRLLADMLALSGYRLNENSYDKMNEALISEI